MKNGSRALRGLTALALTLSVPGLVLPKAQSDDVAFTTESYPKVDGSVVAQPLAVAYERAFTSVDVARSDTKFTDTDQAYHNLLSGAADLIVTTEPTQANLDAAQAAGVQLDVTPVADEAFVFLTNADNAVTSLTLDQVRGIYSGQITDWSQVGGTPGPITAYQRDASSSSQTGMSALVMQGAAMMSPPVVRTPTAVGWTSSTANFDGQPGAIGYSYDYYANAIWPDVANQSTGTEVKAVQIDGVAPTTAAIQSGAYPLVTPYYIVMNKDQPKNSGARKLAQAMVSSQGQDVASQAGYTPVGDASSPSPGLTTSTGPDSTALASLDQTFQVNPAIVTTTNDYVAVLGKDGSVEHCASVTRATISGLTNTDVATSLTTELRNRQDSALQKLWGTDQLVSGPSCSGQNSTDPSSSAQAEIDMTTSVTANFGNVLSVVSFWHSTNRSQDSTPAATLNVRLDTGVDLSFADLFVSGTNVASMIQAEARVDEQTILTWVDAYQANPAQQFSFTSSGATIYLPGSSGLTIPFSAHWRDVAIFNLASSATDVYSDSASTMTCPVLTYPRGDFCWTDDVTLVADLQAPSAGGNLSVPISVATQDAWRVVSATDGLVGSVTSVSGQGSASVPFVVAPNPANAARTLSIGLQVTNATTHLGHMGYIMIAQAGNLDPATPTISVANASQVAGLVPLPMDSATTVSLVWPDSSHTDLVPVGPDGSWAVATPVGMESGTVSVTTRDNHGNGLSSTATLDTSVPNAPVVSTANASEVAGTTDPGTTLSLTWPDGSVAHPVETNGTWSVPTPETMTSGTVSVIAQDAASNFSDPVQAALDTVPPGQPVITTVSVDQVTGTVSLPVDAGTIVSVTWPDGSSSGAVSVDAAGTWSVAVPASVTDLDGQVVVVASDPAGNQSRPTSVAMKAPAVDPAASALTITSDPVHVTIPACGGEPRLSSDLVTAQVAVVGPTGAPVPGASVTFSASDGLVIVQPNVTTDDTGVAAVTAMVDLATVLTGAQLTVSAQVLSDQNWVDVSNSPAQVTATTTQVPDPVRLPIASVSPADGSPVPADNSSAYSVSVDWTDGCDHPVVGQTVTFQVDGSAELSAASAQLDAQGHAEVTVTDPLSETVSVQVSATDSTGETVQVQDAPVQVSFAPPMPDPFQSSVSVATSLVEIPCGGTGGTTVTAMIKDQAAHPLANLTVLISVDGQAQASQTSIVTDSDGMVSWSVSDPDPETVTMTVQVQSGDTVYDLANSPITLTFVPGCTPPSSSSLWFVVSQGPKVADDQDAYTVTVYAKDVNGGAVKGLTDQLSVSSSNQAVTTTPLTDQNNGSYVCQVTADQAGVFPLRVTMKYPDGTLRDLANSPADLTFVATWSTTLAASTDSITTPVRLADGQDAYTVTADISARIGVSDAAPLAGQASLLSIREALATDDSSALPDGVEVSAFTETRPGVYTAKVTSSQVGRYDIVVAWQERGTDGVRSKSVSVNFGTAEDVAVAQSSPSASTSKRRAHRRAS
ncbi:MAG: Ig-like domain-containing protein [Propionibacteriaceae bacterium]|nr:Ig-like domain-containing protein [Propionibacteriaceae bacterium]